jgi:hypothetical protein
MRMPSVSRIVPVLLIALALVEGGSPAVQAADGREALPAQATAPLRDTEAEHLGLRLLNCTRTGGWVRVDGTCKGRASGRYSAYVRPLRLDEGLSTDVAFPWAAELVLAGACDHALPGKPVLGARLAAAGFEGTPYGENVGCSWGGMATRDMVVAVHRAMQAEKAGRGGHWRNMKERGFHSVGIGVATLEGMTSIVFDFYGE